MTNIHMDVRGVIKKFGGRAQLYRKLCVAKVELSHRTIDNWIQSGIIPMHRFLQLMALAKNEGFTLNLKEHTKNERPHKLNDTRTGVGVGNAANDAASLQA